MNPSLLRIYHRLPSPARSFATSLHGYTLRSWRYGAETEQLVAEALEQDNWTPVQWRRWREERLAFILHRAATRVPYYRELWAARRRLGERASYEVLENWPVLAKETLRTHPHAFIADDCDPRRMYRDSTSGTTGTPLSIYASRATVRQWYAIFEARLRRWHGVSYRDRWAIMGGQMVVPLTQKRPPYWVFNAGLNQLYLSTFHLSASNARAYADALRRFQPTHMIVYPSSANLLAAEFLEQQLETPLLKAIFSNAETLFDQHRATISRAFQASVVNTYGMGEAVVGASECPAGTMHLWPEIGLVEVLQDDADVAVTSGGVGRLISTSLLNADMPLIRYAVGDRGSIATEGKTCSCGRTLPAMPLIEGRANDLILTVDGRRIFWLNPIFYGLPVRESQIIQETIDHLRIRIVPSTGYAEQHGAVMVQRLRERVGDARISLELVESIPRSKNGKLRAVVSNLQ